MSSCRGRFDSFLLTLRKVALTHATTYADGMEPVCLGNAGNNYHAVGAVVTAIIAARGARMDLRRPAQWHGTEGGRQMFVSFNQLTVPQAEQQEMLEVFRQHTESMKQVPGCLSFELWMDGDTMVSVSHWDSKSSRDNYLKSDVYRDHHPAHGGSRQHGSGSGHVHADAHAQRPRRPSKISQFTVEKLL